MISRTKAISSLVAIISLALSTLPIAFANTGVLENTQDCYDAGYKDGRDSPFDGGANDICRQFTDDQGNPYYSGFIYECMSVQSNTMDGCESATD
ncbi:MAG: hypothetical protein WAK50_09600 [Nitrososphaeraceae archaeon]|jgi:hypothetical protein